jgi:phage shock protein C
MKRKPTNSSENSEPTKASLDSRLFRSKTSRILGGVAGGLGEYLQIDPTIIRIAFMLITIFGGSGLILYLVLWLIVPTKDQSDNPDDYISDNIKDFKAKTREFGSTIQAQRGNTRYFLGLILLGLGVIFLMENFGMLPFFRMERFWPLLLIVLGLLMMNRK